MYKWVRSMDSLLKRFKRNKRFFFFFKFVGVPGGSPELEKGNPGVGPLKKCVKRHVGILGEVLSKFP